MPSTYNHLGIKFVFPENWEIAQDEDPSLPRTISVHSPTGAFWSTTLHDIRDDPKQLVDEIVETISAEYEDIERESIDQPIVDRSTLFGFQLDFYCLDLLVTCRVFAVETNEFVLTFVYQGESRDFDALNPVFDAISFNMLRNLESTNGVRRN